MSTLARKPPIGGRSPYGTASRASHAAGMAKLLRSNSQGSRMRYQYRVGRVAHSEVLALATAECDWRPGVRDWHTKGSDPSRERGCLRVANQTGH
jgi:hypothetical protein